ncbi:MAG: AMP-binding protein [Hydrogenophaga sp.]|uniref:AMP-binding protein n=1 Tax=Hydrogenophaga sp. TaxID=1904254 RepID=UPI0016A2C312|nr:AMP-binding protein [Hydrogenophaga sp.]NIM43940.1 AMP-binding protein [Hydrogenophaga sp.]NIN29004.1 AMP-binding protein [Hydrogenophaga sp.]NIN33481.1 AMP-binding protein [Hydrogenophaga sp.]NIN58140.1 AMP-binding protein [Hydrogenophaga sp.]NIO54438.1 AMP-binding protein [Hydrogenophaga sp.]
MKAFTSLADIEALERRPLAEVAPQRTPYGLIRAAAERFAEREAFTFLPDADLASEPRRVSYRELLAMVHRAANAFRALGIGPGDSVALLAPNTPEAHAVLWGAQLAGRVCPINTLLQPDHIAALMQAANAKVLVALGPNAEFPVIWASALKVQALYPCALVPMEVSEGVPGLVSLQALMAAQPETLSFEPDLDPDRVVALFHTGGTTGAPKLAQHTAGNEAHTASFAHAYYDCDERSVEVNGFPLFHVAGAFVYGLALLATGARQVLPTLTGMRNTGFVQNYWRFCEREGVTHLACVPTVLASLLGVPIDADTSRIRAAYTGGSPLPTELAQRFEAGTGIPVRNILGMTECAGLVSIEPLLAPREPGSAGWRLPYTDVFVVPWRDGEAKLDERCAAEETGVVVLRGPHMSPGYLDATRNVGMFEQGWIVSGDLGHLDATGRVHITGRAKDLIIRGSHNIDPGLVEDAFLAHPAVAQCSVVAEPDAHSGEVPVAFVVLRPGMSIASDALLREVAPRVYERPAVPKRVVVISALPLTAIGKVFKPALRLHAIELKLADLARELAPRREVQVDVVEEGGRQRATVRFSGPADAGLAEALKAALAAIAVPTEVVFDAGG